MQEDSQKASPVPPQAGKEAGKQPGQRFDPAVEDNSFVVPGEDDSPLPAQRETSAITQLDPEQCLYGVRMQRMGQVLFFPGQKEAASIGDNVLVGLDKGQVLGEVVCINTTGELAPAFELGEGDLLGCATAQDIATNTENRILAAEAAAFCKTCIRQRTLDMKLVDVDVLHDRSKIIFFFTAPTRIDFRDLVKDLVRNYRTRIELRQIGVRHEAQMVGGIGSCGMVCCCQRYLRKFAPVTIKMAKEQNLFLNPSKLSGMCGRLLCCLSFEQGNYEEFNRRSPKLGKRYQVAEGVVRVTRSNLFSRTVFAVTESNTEVSYSLEDWENMNPKRVETPPEGKKTDTVPAREPREARAPREPREGRDSKEPREPRDFRSGGKRRAEEGPRQRPEQGVDETAPHAAQNKQGEDMPKQPGAASQQALHNDATPQHEANNSAEGQE